MIHYLQEHWCQDTEVLYEWVKGHADNLNQDSTKLEGMNIVADELCDVIRETERVPFGARPNCGMWPRESCDLFIIGVKVTRNWKQRLIPQLLDGFLQEYLMQKEQWLIHSFNKICWKRKETALKQISKARQKKQQRCVITYGTLALVMKNYMGKQNRAACAAIMKTEGMS
jgi:hypothetical protein